ncbi:MAG TPA: DNA polymerase III subunit epsilon [Alphaproteobacteria bacterium]|jgi:DNA polymerase-3 subunit epsilon|nr:DNA polymerase III subunit epsilon [Alphaproteobacteria bacterium]
MRRIALDTETTGLNPIEGHRVVEIGCVELDNNIPTGKEWHTYLNPERSMPEAALAVHGLDDNFLSDKPLFKDISLELLNFIEGAELVIHNARFDIGFLNNELNLVNLPIINIEEVIDTVQLARQTIPGAAASLDALCKRFDIDLSQRGKHGALLDAQLLAEVYLELTGGRQVSLVLNQTSKNLDPANKVKIESKDLNYVVAVLTKEEDEQHQKMLQKIKEPIWLK